MKIVVNKCYGGFSVSKDVCEKLGLESVYDADRYDTRLIQMVEEDPQAVGGYFAALCVVEIPDDATDHTIIDYDGCETVLYVMNGKIYRT